MKGPWKSSFILVAATLALACQTQDTATEQGSETSPAVDAEAVRESILAKDQAFADAMVAGEVEPLVLQYTADAALMPPNSPKVEGSQAIREAFAEWFQQGSPTAMSLNNEEITVAAAGDYAYAVGTFTMSGSAPDGSEWSDEGKYVVVWQNVEGDWKMAADIWNSSTPPPGMAAQEAGVESEEAAP